MRVESGLAERIVHDALDALASSPWPSPPSPNCGTGSPTGISPHGAYDAIGGVTAALAGYAESVYTHRLLTRRERRSARDSRNPECGLPPGA
jgi:hypothetical protein